MDVDANRTAGVLLHPTSLPSPYGIGNIGPASRDFVKRLAQAGQSYWQVLPLGPTAFADSPYQCLSSYAGNQNLISLEDLIHCGWLTEKDLEDRPHFRERRVDYQPVIAWHDELLHLAFERFLMAGDLSEFHAWSWMPEQTWLEDYSLYIALKEKYDLKPWVEWPRRDAFYGPQTHAAVEKDTELRNRILEHKFRQWVFFKQWYELKATATEYGIQLIGDLPIYVGHDSCDVWTERGLFDLSPDGHLNTMAGVPPDSFSPTGQRWGNPLYLWDRHRDTGYAWWQQRIRATLRMVDLVRVDHFRAFDTYWEIPGGDLTAERGVWKHGPGDDFFNRLDAETKKRLIAEDLGENMTSAIALRRRHGMMGMSVAQFAYSGTNEERWRFDPANPDNADCVVYTGTHDNQTAMGWWYLDAVDSERRLFNEACLKHPTPSARLADGPNWSMIWLSLNYVSQVSIVPLQDLLGLGDSGRMNRPGTTMPQNWSWRCTQEQLDSVDWARYRKMCEATARVPARVSRP